MTGLERVLLALLVLLAPFAVAAQPQPQTPKPAHIGFLWTASATAVSSYRDAFADGLRQLGYVEGRDVTVAHRYAEDRLEALPGLVSEILRAGVGVVVAQGTPAARAAKKPRRRSRSSHRS